MSDPVRRSRPGGRSARIRRAVLDATVDELLDRGYDALSLSSISRRAGVDRVTLYRRWGSVGAILADVLSEGGPTTADEVPDTGSFRGDVRALMLAASATLTTPRALALTRALNAAAAPEVEALRAEVWVRREATLEAIIQRAVARGETPAPLFPRERIADALFGAAQFRLVVRRLEPHPDDLDHYVDLLALMVLGEAP